MMPRPKKKKPAKRNKPAAVEQDDPIIRAIEDFEDLNYAYCKPGLDDDQEKFDAAGERAHDAAMRVIATQATTLAGIADKLFWLIRVPLGLMEAPMFIYEQEDVVQAIRDLACGLREIDEGRPPMPRLDGPSRFQEANANANTEEAGG